MLELLPEWMRERVSDHLDRITHTATVVTVAFTGLSLEQLVLIIPALISGTVSILAFFARRKDRKRRMEIYREEEQKRTEAMVRYLESVKDAPSSSAVVMAGNTIHKAIEKGEESGKS